jgi:DNA-binding transcriptional MerR regulator
MTEYVTIGEAARMLGVSPSTVRRLGEEGLLTVFRRPTKENSPWSWRYFSRTELEEFVLPKGRA